MDYLPIFLNIREQRCLVVGGGEVATRKATMLMRAGARVQVVAPEIAPALSEKLSKHEGHYRKGGYETADLNDVAIVIAATDDEALNRRVYEDCRARQLPVNVVDAPALCTFIFPSIVDRSEFVIASSS